MAEQKPVTREELAEKCDFEDIFDEFVQAVAVAFRIPSSYLYPPGHPKSVANQVAAMKGKGAGESHGTGTEANNEN